MGLLTSCGAVEGQEEFRERLGIHMGTKKPMRGCQNKFKGTVSETHIKMEPEMEG